MDHRRIMIIIISNLEMNVVYTHLERIFYHNNNNNSKKKNEGRKTKHGNNNNNNNWTCFCNHLHERKINFAIADTFYKVRRIMMMLMIKVGIISL